MRVVFVGASHFGLRCLQLLEGLDDFETKGVVTAPKKFKISYHPGGVINVLHADIRDYCALNNVPCEVIREGMNDEGLFKKVSFWKPDLFVVSGWYHMIPRNWRELAPAYGLHASLLPDYSGGAPLVWAIINGERETGITLFQFDDGVDSGPILGQSATVIEEADTIATLYARIEELGLELIRKCLPALAKGTARMTLQDHSKRRIFAQRKPEDGIIDWRKSALDLYNFIRAQTRPYPGAFTTLNGKHISIWKACRTRHKESQVRQHGEVSRKQEATLVNTGAGFLEIVEATYDQRNINGQELRRIVGGGRAILGT